MSLSSGDDSTSETGSQQHLITHHIHSPELKDMLATNSGVTLGAFSRKGNIRFRLNV